MTIIRRFCSIAHFGGIWYLKHIFKAFSKFYFRRKKYQFENIWLFMIKCGQQMSLWTCNGHVTTLLKDNACNIKILFNWSFWRYWTYKTYFSKHFQSFISEEKDISISICGIYDTQCSYSTSNWTPIYYLW